MSKVSILVGDCLTRLKQLPDNSTDAIITDPPYFKVKGEAWDNQWSDADKFIEWIGTVAEQWQRLLKPNGSLYCFASSRMSAWVEVELSRRFNILNRIRWAKPKFATKAEMFTKEDLRCFFPSSEEIIFAEHYGADNAAKGEAGYVAKCDELRGFVFEPLRAYLDGERKRAGVDKVAVNVACGFSATAGGMASRHYFSRSQWMLPTATNYAAMQRLFNEQGRRPAPPYEDFHEAPRARFERNLRADYEYLRADYEDLRRPFFASADRPYTDTWTFDTVKSYPGKHPCEKPQELLRHILRTSTRPGAVVLDCFMGGGSMGEACVREGRNFVGVEQNEEYAAAALKRVSGCGGLFDKVEVQQ